MTPLPLLASIRAALEQPVFPGKVIVWLLFMLSIVGWVMIISKSLQFWKFRRADLRFTNRLRQSKTTLEALEEGWEEEHSLKLLIYLAGAQETARQLLGMQKSPEREGQPSSLRGAGKLVERQLIALGAAFQSGYRVALRRLRAGIEGLFLIGVSALFLGAFGLVWSLMKSVDTASEFSEMAPMIGGGLGHLVIALCVAAPTMIVRLVLHGEVKRREVELERFRDDINRLFERSFAAAPESPSVMETKPQPAREAEATPFAATSTGSVESEKGKKRFHSIRDRLLRTGSGEESELDEAYPVNPIARQAAALSGRSTPKPKY